MNINKGKKVESVEELGHLRTPLENIPLGYQSLDETGNFIEINKTWCELLGYTKDEVLGRNFSEFIHPDFREHLKEDFLKLKSMGNIIETEFRMIKKCGSELVVSLDGKIAYNDDGTAKQIHCLIKDITRRKQAEKILRRSEERFRNLVEMFPEAIFETDADTNIIYANQRAFELFGYSNEDLAGGLKGLDLIIPEDRDRAKVNLAKRLKGENPGTFEYQALKKDGSVFPIHYNADSINLNGELIGLRGIIVDITEHKRAEETLRKSKEIAENYLNVASEIIVSLNEEGTILLLNDSGHRILGYKRGELVGKNWFDTCLPEKIRTEVRITFKKLLQGDIENVKTYENPIVTKDGHEKTIVWHNTVLYDENGEIYGILSSGEDITDKKKVADELRKLSFAIEQSANIVVITDVEGIIEYVNPKFTEVTGYTRDEALGQNPRILKSGEMSDESYKELWNTIASGKIWSGEFRNMKKNGELYWEKATITPVIDKSGSITNYLAIKEDITEQKALEKEHQMLEIEINQARKLEAIGSLAAGIAHEINTPIQFVGDNTNFLSDSFKSLMSLIETYKYLWQRANTGAAMAELNREIIDAEQNVELGYLQEEIPSAIEQTLDGVKRVTKIVRAMKDFAHNDQGEKSLSNINDMLASCLTVSLNELKYVANIKTNYCQNLPEIECYRDDLNQVFLNLLINAAHTIADVVGDASAGKGTITVATQQDNDNVIIKISDTGTGIPPTIQDRIFDPFFSTKDVGKGSGQGLAIAHKIVVEKHEGSLEFETEENKGTTFIIRIPINARQVVEV